jgi:hypothetical protein
MKFNNFEEIVAFVKRGVKLPDWQKQLYSKYSKEVKVHSKGELFYKIDRLFPNEHKNSKEHRVLSFESVTKGSFWKGVNNVQQIFQNSSYTVSANEKTIEFISADNFEGQSLFSFFLEKWCQTALPEDPNSLIVVYPFEFMKRGKTFNQVLFIPSEHICFQDNETIMFISEEESEKKYSLKTTRIETKVVFDQSVNDLNLVESAKDTFAGTLECEFIRKVYHVFTMDGFYSFEETEKGSGNFNYYYYLHEKNFLPCIKAGGRDTGKGIFESFFSVFVPFGNLTLLQHSQHTAVNFIFSFPRMSEIEIPCDAFGCNSGRILVEASTEYPEGYKLCAQCGGSGYKTNQTPYKIYRKRLEPNTMNEDVARAVLNADDVKYYTPPTDVLNYSKQEWRDYLELAEGTVYVSQKVKTGNVESAASKEQDFKDRYNFLSTIAKVFYSRLRSVIQFYENYMNDSPVTASVNIPYSFAIVSEGEALDTLQGILAGTAPVIIKANLVENFINKYVSQNSPVKKMFAVLKRVDLLLFYTDLQLAAQKAAGIVTAQQWAIHVFSFPALAKMYNDDKTLFEKSEADIEDLLMNEIEPLFPNTSDLKTSLLEKMNNNQ